MNEAEKLAERLRDIVTKYRFVSHEHGVIDGAAALLRSQAEQIRELRSALEGVMEGCVYRQIQGEWAWHEKTMPTNVALNRARATLSNTKEAE